MSTRRFAGTVAATIALVLLVAGCTTTPRPVVEGSTVVLAVSERPTSLNTSTTVGSASSAETNRLVAQATRSSFSYYNDVPELVMDESFGRAELVSSDPLVVKYSIVDGTRWSDGTRVDAADLLLAWAALSGALDTPEFDPVEFVDSVTGTFTGDFPDDVVYFDGAVPTGLELVSQTPEIGGDGRSITVRFDADFADWPIGFPVDVPAHVVAKNSLSLSDDRKAKDALIAAIEDNDRDSLAGISRFWNTGFLIDGMPDDPELLLSSGPYVITDVGDGAQITLAANPEYSGARQPHIETVTVRTIADGMAAVTALADGDVDVISPIPSVDVLAALDDLDVTVAGGSGSTFEHIDLQFDESRNGHFDDQRVREAFLKVVPRREILETLIEPLQESATLRDSHLFMSGSPGYADSVENSASGDYQEVDVEGAKALLVAATVKKPEVCILFAEGNPRRQSEFVLIRTSAARAGFVVTDCSSPDWRDLLGVAGRYDAALFGWEATGLGVTGAALQYATGAPNNANYYSSDAVDASLIELSTTFDPVAQSAILADIDAQLWEDAYGLPLFQYPRVVAFDDARVTGVTSAPFAPGVGWNIWGWKPVATS